MLRAMANVREVPFTTLHDGWHSSVVTGGLSVVRSDHEWSRVWRELVGHSRPIPPTPAVDWLTNMVLVFAIGGRPSGGFTASIDRLECDGKVLRVFASEHQPNPALPAPAVVSSPYHAIVTRRSDLPIELVGRVEIQDCD